jgi:hypothetical protein
MKTLIIGALLISNLAFAAESSKQLKCEGQIFGSAVKVKKVKLEVLEGSGFTVYRGTSKDEKFTFEAVSSNALPDSVLLTIIEDTGINFGINSSRTDAAFENNTAQMEYSKMDFDPETGKNRSVTYQLSCSRSK